MKDWDQSTFPLPSSKKCEQISVLMALFTCLVFMDCISCSRWIRTNMGSLDSVFCLTTPVYPGTTKRKLFQFCLRRCVTRDGQEIQECIFTRTENPAGPTGCLCNQQGHVMINSDLRPDGLSNRRSRRSFLDC